MSIYVLKSNIQLPFTACMIINLVSRTCEIILLLLEIWLNLSEKKLPIELENCTFKMLEITFNSFLLNVESKC